MDDYAYYLYVNELPELLAATNALEARLRPTDPVGADRVIRAYATLRDELIALGFSVSAKGTEILRDQERKSRVRPDTLGEGGPRLEDYLDCDPLSAVLWGSVGIANETRLDENVEWWSTNEEGSTSRVGHVLYGVFQPGEAVPDAGEFREHPIFEARPSGTFRASGVIRNPIPARRFVEHSIADIELVWLAGFDRIKQTFIDEVSIAQGLP